MMILPVPASGRKRIVLLLLIALACSACYVGTHYHGWQYRGGRFTNHGLLNRPRYVAQFPEISTNRPGMWACAPCRLQIWIGPVDPTTLSLRIFPALHGGGWELP